MSASYLKLPPAVLRERALLARRMLSPCEVCPHLCRVDRSLGEAGFCRGGCLANIASYGPHFGEEDVLVGTDGSGTIFFAYCNLACRFCQNWEISYCGEGDEVDAKTLSRIMVSLERRGCHNINLVSPSHFVPQILESLCLAVEEGLTVPLVYNTGGYDSVKTLGLLNGVVDIYMPDLKFGEDQVAARYTGVKDYFSVATRAIAEMHRQVGDLVVDAQGLAVRGLLLRHLVLPKGLSGTKRVVEFIAGEISKNTFINIMDQYHPTHRAPQIPELTRPITGAEYREALNAAEKAGLTRIYQG